ncbi:hypothetical protein ACHHYP_05660 [Achlya hypogyna]|uniref:Protein kinase domain-containing protein n=1 Tax=Achlya hypogyna TaxID=1202772 RepID=A0A1V9YX90_ACHHY|nr:hypothetical protein ACHHYP_05660 [Achlya hypogyna]
MGGRVSSLHEAAGLGKHDIAARLLQSGAVLMAEDTNHWTALHAAVSCGHVGVVRLLLEAKANIHKLTEFGQTPLYLAAWRGHVKAVQCLIDAGASVGLATLDGSTPLLAAASEGHDVVVRLLLHCRADIDKADNDGTTPLHAAAGHGHAIVVQTLLDAKAGVGKITLSGDTCLHAAAAAGRDDVVKILLGANVGVNATSNWGVTPLHKASIEGHAKVVRQLLRAGASVDVPEEDGYTALHAASLHGHETVLAILIAANASIHATTKDGRTPLYLAALKGRVGIVRTLLIAGVKINQAAMDGSTPLCAASEQGHEAIVSLLLKANADVSLKKTDGTTALIAAAMNGHATVVQLLLRANADATQYSETATTPLHTAVMGGHALIAKELLNAGASPDAPDVTGVSPLMLARELNDASVLALFPEAAPYKAGDTLLHLAVHRNDLAVLNLLLRAAAIEPYKCNKTRGTPLTTAIRLGQRDVAQAIYSAAHAPFLDVPRRDIKMEANTPLGQKLCKATFRSHPVVVKTASDQLQAAAIAYEIEVLQLCKSPYLSELVAVAGQGTAAPIMALKRMDGGSLRDFLDKKRLGHPTQFAITTLDVAWVLANGLADLHHNGILHMDLTSANVLLCSTSYIRLANIRQTSAAASFWTAPEVLVATDAYDYAADIYSFGVILTELETCALPYSGLALEPSQVVLQVRQGLLRPDAAASSERWLRQLTDECLAFDPRQRPNINIVVDVLEQQIARARREVSNGPRGAESPRPATINDADTDAPSATDGAAGRPLTSCSVSTVALALQAPHAAKEESAVQSMSEEALDASLPEIVPPSSHGLPLPSIKPTTVVSSKTSCAHCSAFNSLADARCCACDAVLDSATTRLQALLERIVTAQTKGVVLDTTIPCPACKASSGVAATACRACGEKTVDDEAKLRILVDRVNAFAMTQRPWLGR